ncbi:MAG: hypothetical protein U1E26_06195 [Coriobacteriia bacterium]|nr:hypothetical protein [Coriobacteriia bacterium]
MGQLHDAVQVVEGLMGESGGDVDRMRGLIGMKAGFFLIIIKPDTPDDPAKLASLRAAAEDVLGRKMPF